MAEIHPPQTGKIYAPQIGAFIEILSLRSRSSSLPTNLSSKCLSSSVDGPKKHTITNSGAPFKGGSNTNTVDTPPHAASCEHATDDTDFSSQGIATSTQPPLYKNQILQDACQHEGVDEGAANPNRSRSGASSSRPRERRPRTGGFEET